MPINSLIALASFILNILVLLVAVAGFIKITANDLKHLSKDVNEIKENLKQFTKSQNNIEKKIVKIETRCKILHK
jgi:hypothetical protein